MNPEEDKLGKEVGSQAANCMTPQSCSPKDSLLYHIDREIDQAINKLSKLRDLRRSVGMEKPHIADLIFQAKWILS